MRKLTILVDMDEVLDRLLEAWVSRLNRSYGTDVKTDDIVQWDISKTFHTLTSDQIFSPLLCDDFWYGVLPVDGASEALQKLLADGHEVFVVTSSGYQTIQTKMDCVLFRYYPFLSWENVIIASRKQLIKGDVLVDDGVHNLEGGEYLGILMDAPHNRSCDAEANGMHRAKDWQDIYAIITELANTDY